MRLIARSTYPANPWEINLTIDLQHLNVNQYSAAVDTLNRLRHMLEGHWREVAYQNGESNGDANWVMALAELLPEGTEPTPHDVAAYIRAEQQRLR